MTWLSLKELSLEGEHCFHLLPPSNLKKNSWYLDSGCFKHMIGGKSHFMKLMPKSERNVTFGDNSKGLIEAISFIGINYSTIIENMLYVNGLKLVNI
ncbi:hypothetical protein J1N35_018641 [Gossypium stocksii]|uniref:Retrovirus-related Pol polyprotein from transposon TNT 1-94-like beta-barrel domain-containing protein n=1 Tax=Gossypium stocksii TaxID=47602 RepID=A0A9D3VQ56_9ROSI|nr:hypothetical protein J1N35_018641 [Gossypium stocksii]